MPQESEIDFDNLPNIVTFQVIQENQIITTDVLKKCTQVDFSGFEQQITTDQMNSFGCIDKLNNLDLSKKIHIQAIRCNGLQCLSESEINAELDSTFW